jgi:6-phosphogluconolactonase
MTALKIKTPLTNPSYVLIHNSFIYVVEETNGGRLTVLSSKTYEILKSVPTSGNDPCHISMNSIGNLIVATNYSSGSFIMYRI